AARLPGGSPGRFPTGPGAPPHGSWPADRLHLPFPAEAARDFPIIATCHFAGLHFRHRPGSVVERGEYPRARRGTAGPATGARPPMIETSATATQFLGMSTTAFLRDY